MLGGGATFLAGAAINGSAKNIAMLIIDRILLGIGVGFANQVMTHQSYILCLYDARMSRSSNVKPCNPFDGTVGAAVSFRDAPARLRGMLNIGFQLMITTASS